MAITSRSLLDTNLMEGTLADLQSQFSRSAEEIATLRKGNQKLQDILDAPSLREQKARLDQQNMDLEERLDQVLTDLKRSKQANEASNSSAPRPRMGTIMSSMQFETTPVGITIWRDENTLKNAKIIDFQREGPRRRGLAKGDYVYKVNKTIVWDREHNQILEEIQHALQNPPISLTFFRPTGDIDADSMRDKDFESTLASIGSHPLRHSEEWGSSMDANKPPNQALLRYRGKLLLEMVCILTGQSSIGDMSLVDAYVSSWGASYSTISDLSSYEPSGKLEIIRTMLNSVPIDEKERQTFGLLSIYDAICLLSVDVSNAHLDESNGRHRAIFAHLAASLGCEPEQLSNMYELVNGEREDAKQNPDVVGVTDLSLFSPEEPTSQNVVDNIPDDGDES